MVELYRGQVFRILQEEQDKLQENKKGDDGIVDEDVKDLAKWWVEEGLEDEQDDEVDSVQIYEDDMDSRELWTLPSKNG